MWSAAWRPTQAQTLPPSKTVCIPEAKARVIDADLAKYPLVLKENKRLRKAIGGYAYGATRDSVALAAKDTVIAATERRVNYSNALYRDADNRAAIYQKKASKRGWQNIGLAAVAALMGFFAVTK